MALNLADRLSQSLRGGAVPAALRDAAAEVVLRKLYRPIAPGLARTERELGFAAARSGHVIRPMAQHLLRRQGKRVRAALVLFAARAGRGVPASAPKLAAAVEMLHMASLVHDDILDGAETRRNQPALHAEWGTHRAVLMGDWLFATTFNDLARQFPLPVTRSLLGAAAALCDGELEETAVTWDANVSEARYLDIIGKKTAALMAAACEAGALLARAPASSVRSLRDYGWAFGMAFQLIDDALNFSGNRHEVGKPVGSDITEGKFTMPVLSVREMMRGAEQRRFRRLLTPPSLNNGGARTVMQLIRERGGLDATLDRAEGYLRDALRAVRGLPAAAGAPLGELAGYALARRR